MAGRYWKKGEIDKAISEYETVYQINPNYALVYNSLGYLHAQSGYFSKAIEYMKKYVFIAPDQANPYDSLGDILIRVGRYREALDQFDKAIAVKPTLAVEPSNLSYAVQTHMAIALMRSGKLQEAKYRFNRALDLSTGEWAKGEVAVKSTELYRTQGQYSEAIDALLKAQNPEGYNRAINLTLGLIYSDLGEVEKIGKLIDVNLESTIKCVQKCLKDSIEITEENCSQYLDDCGKCQILTRDEQLLKALHDRAMGRYLNAAERVDKLIVDEKVSDMKMFLMFLSSNFYFEAGKYQQALKTLEPFIAINPNDPDVVLIKAESLMNLGQLDEAVKVLKMFVHATDGADADWIPRVKARALLAELDREPITMN
jgi:tetratricopeptide (TPR) repeat protein